MYKRSFLTLLKKSAMILKKRKSLFKKKKNLQSGISVWPSRAFSPGRQTTEAQRVMQYACSLWGARILHNRLTDRMLSARKDATVSGRL